MENTLLGIPIFLAEESPYGHMAIGATVFPNGQGMASTFSTSLMEKVGKVVSKEIRLQFQMVQSPRIVGGGSITIWGNGICRNSGSGEGIYQNLLVRLLSQNILSEMELLRGAYSRPTFIGKRELLEQFLSSFS